MTKTKTHSNTHTHTESPSHPKSILKPSAPPPPAAPTATAHPHDLHWRDYYPPSPLPPDAVLPKPPHGIRLWSTKWKNDNPNPKSAAGRKQAYMGQGMMGGYGGYGGGMGMGGMYPGMGMGGGMYPGMGMGMGGYGMGMGGGGMYPPMMGGIMGGGGYGMPRYPGGGMYGGAMGGMYGGGYGMDPYYGMPPAAMLNDDFPDAHRYQGSTQDFPFHNSSHFHRNRPYPPSFYFPPPPPHYHRDAENLHNATRQYDTNGAYDPSAHHKLLGAMAIGYDPLTDRHNQRPGQLQLMPGDTPLDDDPLLRRRRAPLAIAPAPLA